MPSLRSLVSVVISMSEDQDLEKPNFRSSYYVSLGVRAGEQSLISHLEGLIKAEAVGEASKCSHVGHSLCHMDVLCMYFQGNDGFKWGTVARWLTRFSARHYSLACTIFQIDCWSKAANSWKWAPSSISLLVANSWKWAPEGIPLAPWDWLAYSSIPICV